MQGLPKLPGLDFTNHIKARYSIPQHFEYKNGYIFPKTIMKEDEGTESAVLYDPVLTYGRVTQPPTLPFRPHFVIYDKMTLTFHAFFKQSVTESANEHFRVRFVNIIFFLEDDTITVMEPETRNSGIPQGRLLRRGKIAKNLSGECYTWRDFNIGIDILLNGIVFHITDCDQFTKDFLASEGIDLNEVETPPTDPLTQDRHIRDLNSQLVANKLNPKQAAMSSDDDKLRRFLEFQGKVLRFQCLLDETDRPNGEAITYSMYYFLEDDTVSIKELSENQEGRDRFPKFLNRTKLPKNWRRRPTTFPSIFLEISDREVDEYYQPKDFTIGQTIFIYGRRFLLLDCDKFTRQYFSDILKIQQPDELKIKFPEKPSIHRPLPDYLGLGTPEDSLASCFGLRPKPPKKDVIKYLLNSNKYLRYGCVLDSAHPEEQMRKFILSYSLADDTLSIMEPPIRNSGILGGKFLSASRIKLPGCDPNNPIYYGPKHFHIGALLNINNHRFRITDVDLYVYRYMQDHPELFSTEASRSILKHLLINGNLKDELRTALEQELNDYNLNETTQDEKTNESSLEKCLHDLSLQSTIPVSDNVAEQIKKQSAENAATQFLDNSINISRGTCPYSIDPLTSAVIEKDIEE